MKPQNIRCCNLDWLEVHAREPVNQPRDAMFYRYKGWDVREREYGTRVYRQMFTLMQSDTEPLLEIRREPASVGLKGIHEPNECHVRLCNRTCYFDNAAAFLQKFLDDNGYTDVRISRVDICLDFVLFDEGDNPQDFVRRYFRHKYAKINQGRICGHGEDTWSGQEWNSISWGSKTSCVTTKLYNKTMELYDVKLDRFRKPYIREAWFNCGFIDDIQKVTKDGQRVQVWRVEFSLSSAVKNWVAIELNGKSKNFQSLQNTLQTYDTRDKILTMFASLQQHYFRFKKFQANQRKDRCPDKVLFRWQIEQTTYKIGRPNTAFGSGQSFRAQYNRLIEKIMAYQQSHFDAEVVHACNVLIESLTTENQRADLADPWSKEELEFLRKLLFVRTSDPTLTYDFAVQKVMKLLNITERTLNLGQISPNF